MKVQQCTAQCLHLTQAPQHTLVTSGPGVHNGITQAVQAPMMVPILSTLHTCPTSKTYLDELINARKTKLLVDTKQAVSTTYMLLGMHGKLIISNKTA